MKGTHLNGVIYNEINGNLGVDLGRIGTETLRRISHRCQIHNSWHSSKVLKNHTCRLEGNLSIGLASISCVVQRERERERVGEREEKWDKTVSSQSSFSLSNMHCTCNNLPHYRV